MIIYGNNSFYSPNTTPTATCKVAATNATISKVRLLKTFTIYAKMDTAKIIDSGINMYNRIDVMRNTQTDTTTVGILIFSFALKLQKL